MSGGDDEPGCLLEKLDSGINKKESQMDIHRSIQTHLTDD
jgi:hypothetical protein